MEIPTADRFTPTEIAEIADSVIDLLEKDDTLAARLSSIVSRTLAHNSILAEIFIDSLAERFPQSVLSDKEIMREVQRGKVVINPFRNDRLQTSSYDVSLGEYFWTTRGTHPGHHLFNPHNPSHVRRLWQGPFRAKTIREQLAQGEYRDWLQEEDFEGLNLDDPIIILSPGETILAHTEEFIGGRDNITTMMKARSSWGRAFLSVCKDAGWGDVGYFNRWTMEIHNNLVHDWSVVPVGQPIAQMVFFRTNPVMDQQYSESGSYQQFADVERLRENWKPEMMLPKIRRKSSVYS